MPHKFYVPKNPLLLGGEYVKGQLLTSEGFVNGKPCKIIEDFKDDYITQKAIVEFEDGETITIHISDFQIPMNLA